MMRGRGGYAQILEELTERAMVMRVDLICIGKFKELVLKSVRRTAATGLERLKLVRLCNRATRVPMQTKEAMGVQRRPKVY